MSLQELAIYILLGLSPCILTIGYESMRSGPLNLIGCSAINEVPIQVGRIVVGDNRIVGVVTALIGIVVLTEHGAEQTTISTFGDALVIILTRIEGQCHQQGQ